MGLIARVTSNGTSNCTRSRVLLTLIANARAIIPSCTSNYTIAYDAVSCSFNSRRLSKKYHHLLVSICQLTESSACS